MSKDLEDLIRRAREGLAPSAEVTARARARALAAAAGGLRTRMPRILRTRGGRAGAIAVALLLAGGGATAAVTLLQGRGPSGPQFRPALENCFSLSGSILRVPRLHPQVGIDDTGAATAVWVGLDGVVRAAGRPPGGDWDTPRELSAPGARPPVRVGFASSRSGHAAAIWLQDDRVWVAVRPAGGAWSTASSVSRAGRLARPQGSDAPSVAVTEGGDVVVAWVSVAARDVTRAGGGVAIGGEGPRAELAVRPAGASWRAPRSIPGEGWPMNPALAASGEGVIAAHLDLGGAGVLEVDPSDGTLTPTHRLRYPRLRAGATPGRYEDPRVAGSEAGDAVAMSVNGRIVLWTRIAGKRWGAGRTISQAAVESSDPSVSLADDGEVLVAWTGLTRERRADGTLRRARAVYATSGRVGRATQAPARLSRAGRVASQPAGALGGGAALVVWADGTNGFSGRDSSVEASRRPAGGTTFSAPEPLSSVGAGQLFPDAALNGTGQAVAAWARCTRPERAVVEATEAQRAPGWSAPARLNP